MKTEDLINLYKNDGFISSISNALSNSPTAHFFFKGLYGSSDSLIASALESSSKNTLFILNDKEEAAYFFNDLQALLPEKDICLFPASYKKIYQFEETENANILMRAEVLSKLNQNENGLWMVSSPEALAEKVINQQSLLENTFKVKIGEKIDTSFLSELLHSYDFEKTDFVFESGQFSVRGGIIDVYSYSNELPYRIELFGNEVESIRTFNPNTQISESILHEFSILPNVQTRLIQESRTSFFDFIGSNTTIWIKDVKFTSEIIQKYFQKCEQQFKEIQNQTGGSKLITQPSELFDSKEEFLAKIEKLQIIEFGNNQFFPHSTIFDFKTKKQPLFHKDFEVLVEDIRIKQNSGYLCLIASDSIRQLERLESIFHELDPTLKVNKVNLAFREGFIDELNKILIYTDHQIFERFHKYKIKEKFTKSKSLTLKELRTLHPGDYVTHLEHGICRFVGLEKVEVGGRQQEAIRLVFRDDDLMYISIHALHKIAKYSGKEGVAPQMTKLGSGDWDAKKKKVKRQVQEIAKDLIDLYAKRKASQGFKYSPDSFLQTELESSFIYEDTPDQSKATSDVKADMELPNPMDRLVCGDVGFGKTEIAIRAAFKAVCDNKQVAVLVPTTILAMQHFKTFSGRLEKFPCSIEYINRFKTTQQIKDTIKRVAEGKTQILIGTHRLINKDVAFKDLGLLIIDEEQKFGVKVKEKLKEIKINVDTLTLTATPIPRTLHFSLMGARDLSIIATPPPNRQPVTTQLHPYDDIVIRDAIVLELKRKGQVFFVHNRVMDIEQIADKIRQLVPDAKIGIAHGQMEGEKLEKVMMKFVEAEYDILVSTNIIESGLDIPNANTIIINHAHMFGLSDLHQMRGRVGRSNKKAYCYFITPPINLLPSDARKRLSALEEFSELGDGFKVAMRDMDIRGAGSLFGAEQSGFITDVGFEVYHKILDEAILELKQTDYKDLFVHELEALNLKKLQSDCSIETDLSILIPEKYVSNITERLSLYSALDNVNNQKDLDVFIHQIIDRFGPLPSEVSDLTETVKMRWLAESLGIEKLILKNDSLKCFLPSADNEYYYQSEIFGRILKFIQSRPKGCSLKDVNKKLVLGFDTVLSIDEALSILRKINEEEVVEA
ncbi:MAG: transcription-repair coupling factor [Cytophagales bacterium]|nr:MAG: transcription-repair coupling factor [Cytophagales bacterium]